MAKEPPTPTFVDIPHGRLRGETVTWTNRPVRRFLGIPYAQPPVGERRWRAPGPLEDRLQWEGERDATKFGPSCPQERRFRTPFFVREYSEDCLYLNVFSPPEEDVPVGGLPVLIFIHGGFFQGGTSIPYDPTSLISEFGRVIVVTLNYRVGVLGFLAAAELATGATDGVAGNFGLLDQEVAIQWVHKYIAHFSGDSTRLTLWGQSAGGSSVHYLLHLLPPGVIKRAIIHSATIMNPYPLAVARRQYEKLCTALAVDSAERLRELPVGEVISAATTCREFWQPTIDGRVLRNGFGERDETPEWRAAGVESVVVGTTKDEFTLLLPFYDPPVLPNLIQDTYPASTITAATYDATYPPDSYSSSFARTTAILGDARYQAPADRLVLALASDPTRRVYQYRFEHVPPLFRFAIELWLRFWNGSWYRPWTWFNGDDGAGAHHGGELAYLFWRTEAFWGAGVAEVELARRIAGWWIGFVETGEMISVWEKVGQGANGRRVLVVGQDRRIRVEREQFREKEVMFWDGFVRT